MKIGMRLNEDLAQMLMDECEHVFREVRPSLLSGYARYEMPGNKFITVKDGVVIGVEQL